MLNSFLINDYVTNGFLIELVDVIIFSFYYASFINYYK